MVRSPTRETEDEGNESLVINLVFNCLFYYSYSGVYATRLRTLRPSNQSTVQQTQKKKRGRPALNKRNLVEVNEDDNESDVDDYVLVTVKYVFD
jgi:hypothetical protein